MIVEVCWGGIWALSFGLSQFHGHGSWLVCEAALKLWKRTQVSLIWSKLLGALHAIAEGRGAVNFHQSYCKKPRLRPLNPAH